MNKHAHESAESAKSLRILLVEDHRDTVLVMTKLLQIDGHTVETAASLDEAQRKCEEGFFDLLISDIELPDGLAYDLIKDGSSCHGVKGIVVSGHGAEEHIERSRAAGYRAHLVKPLRFDQLRKSVAEVAAS